MIPLNTFSRQSKRFLFSNSKTPLRDVAYMMFDSAMGRTIVLHSTVVAFIYSAISSRVSSNRYHRTCSTETLAPIEDASSQTLPKRESLQEILTQQHKESLSWALSEPGIFWPAIYHINPCHAHHVRGLTVTQYAREEENREKLMGPGPSEALLQATKALSLFQGYVKPKTDFFIVKGLSAKSPNKNSKILTGVFLHQIYNLFFLFSEQSNILFYSDKIFDPDPIGLGRLVGME